MPLGGILFFEDVPLVEFMYLVFSCMPDKTSRRLLGRLCLCDLF